MCIEERSCAYCTIISMALDTSIINDSSLVSVSPIDTLFNLSHHALDLTTSDSEITPNEWTLPLVAETSVRILLAILTVLVNSLVLLTLATTHTLRENPAYLVIGSLAVTDVMVGTSSPAGLAIEMQMVISPWLCRLGYAAMLALCSVSINNLLFISIDRYLVIAHPFRYVPMVTRRRVVIFITGCWVYGSFLSVIFITLGYSREDWRGDCVAEKLYPLWFIVTLTALHLIIPFIIMLYVHIAIFIVARRQQKAVKLSMKRHGAEPSVESKKAKLRAARLLVIPCLYFHVSWAPFFITIVWAVLTNSTVQPQGLERFVQSLGILNSLGNPVLYALSQPVLGRAMLRKLKDLACRARMMDNKKKCRPVESTSLVVPDNMDSTMV